MKQNSFITPEEFIEALDIADEALIFCTCTLQSGMVNFIPPQQCQRFYLKFPNAKTQIMSINGGQKKLYRLATLVQLQYIFQHYDQFEEMQKVDIVPGSKTRILNKAIEAFQKSRVIIIH